MHFFRLRKIIYNFLYILTIFLARFMHWMIPGWIPISKLCLISANDLISLQLSTKKKNTFVYVYYYVAN